jgi:hypothetical protein
MRKLIISVITTAALFAIAGASAADMLLGQGPSVASMPGPLPIHMDHGPMRHGHAPLFG